MNAIDATPPDDFPEQVIMMDKDLAKRHPGKAFYLRIKVEAGIEHVDLDNAVTPREARQMAISQGYAPTHDAVLLSILGNRAEERPKG